MNDHLQVRPSAWPRVAVGLALGALAVQGGSQLPEPWVYAGLLAGGMACLRFRRYFFAALLFGVAWASGYGAWRLAEALPPGEARWRAAVEGTILTIPEPMDRGVRFDFAIDRVLNPKDLALPAHVRLNWYDAGAVPKAGERWRLRVSLRPPRGQANPGGFDYEQWLFAQGIRATGYVRDGADNRRLQPASPFSLGALRQAVHDRTAAALAGSPVAGLILALTMGADEAITAAQWEVLRRTGTAHLIAISGSHIGLIAGIAFFLVQGACARFGAPRGSPPRVAAVAAFAAALLYSAMAGFAIPTQRALIMIAIAMGGVVLRRPLDPPHLLAAALAAVLLYDPLAVVAPGFWLSFGAVALIALAVSGRVRRRSGLGALWAINWATALGLAPILLLFFRQVSLVSPLANVLAVPILGTLLVPLCLAGTILLFVFPTAGTVLLGGAEFILSRTWPVLEWLAALPVAQWSHAEPPPWTIPLALLGAALALAPRGIPARALGWVLLLPAAAFQPERPAAGEFRLVLLDVGQGLASVVETRRRTLVFDTGAKLSPNFDMGQAVLEPYLRHRGIDAIDALVVSHGDVDHSGGAHSLLARFPVAVTYTSRPDDLAGVPALACAAGQRWVWDGVEFTMLGPMGSSGKRNDDSCVLRVRAARGGALLTGDIEKAAEARLTEAYGESLRSEVLVVPHHGSNSSSSREFLRAVSPRYALIPAGYLNRYGFPHREVLARYRDIGARVWNSAEAGAITVSTGGYPDGVSLSRYRWENSRYWRGH